MGDLLRDCTDDEELKVAPRPRISVGIATFNAEEFVMATLRSVFAQTLTDWELILVDDGSTDSTVRLLKGVKDPRVKLLCDGLNKGTAARYNEIVEHACTPFVAILDHDDLMHPLRLEVQLKYLSDHPDVDAVGSAAYVIDGGGSLIGIRRQCEVPSTLRGVLAQGLLCHPSMTARRQWLSGHRYDPALHRLADYDLWCRVWENSTIRVIGTPLVYYRDITSLSPSRYLRSYLEKVRLLMRYGYRRAPTWTLMRILRQVAIICLYCSLFLIGNLRAFRSMHHQLPDDSERSRARSGLDRIMAKRLCFDC